MSVSRYLTWALWLILGHGQVTWFCQLSTWWTDNYISSVPTFLLFNPLPSSPHSLPASSSHFQDPSEHATLPHTSGQVHVLDPPRLSSNPISTWRLPPSSSFSLPHHVTKTSLFCSPIEPCTHLSFSAVFSWWVSLLVCELLTHVYIPSSLHSAQHVVSAQ